MPGASRMVLGKRILACALLLLCSLPGAAKEPEGARIWRVCIGDAAVPPYLYNDATRPGIIERILVQAGREVGLSTILLRYPSPRCRALLESKAVDSWIIAPTVGNLAAFQFPMKGGAVDYGRRIVRIHLVWVKRADTPYDWVGNRMLGGTPAQMLVGARAGLQSVNDPLLKMGFRVDDKAATTHQLLQKLLHGRVDIAVALQEEVEVAMQDPALQALTVLPAAMTTAVYYMGVRQNLPPEMREQIEVWWNAIGRLREAGDYQVR